MCQKLTSRFLVQFLAHHATEPTLVSYSKRKLRWKATLTFGKSKDNINILADEGRVSPCRVTKMKFSLGSGPRPLRRCAVKSREESVAGSCCGSGSRRRVPEERSSGVCGTVPVSHRSAGAPRARCRCCLSRPPSRFRHTSYARLSSWYTPRPVYELVTWLSFRLVHPEIVTAVCEEVEWLAKDCFCKRIFWGMPLRPLGWAVQVHLLTQVNMNPPYLFFITLLSNILGSRYKQNHVSLLFILFWRLKQKLYLKYTERNPLRRLILCPNLFQATAKS